VYILQIVIIVIFIALAIYDIKYLAVPIGLLICGIALAIISYLISDDELLRPESVLLLSIMLLVLYAICKGRMGFGDIVAMMISILSLSVTMLINALIYTSVISVIVSSCFIVNKKTTAKLPYISFIALGHILSCIRSLV